MTNIKLQQNELTNFIKLAKQHKEKYQYKLINGVILLTASAEFLNQMGYFN